MDVEIGDASNETVDNAIRVCVERREAFDGSQHDNNPAADRAASVRRYLPPVCDDVGGSGSGYNGGIGGSL